MKTNNQYESDEFKKYTTDKVNQQSIMHANVIQRMIKYIGVKYIFKMLN